MVTCLLAVRQQFETLPYAFQFVTAGYVPELLGGLLTSGFCAWYTHASCAVGRSPSSHPAAFFGLSTFQMASVASDAEDVIEVPFDDDTTRKEIEIREFDP